RRCRVVCGRLETMLTLAPTRALTRVDLPTFGRPTTATLPQRWEASLFPGFTYWTVYGCRSGGSSHSSTAAAAACSARRREVPCPSALAGGSLRVHRARNTLACSSPLSETSS